MTNREMRQLSEALKNVSGLQGKKTTVCKKCGETLETESNTFAYAIAKNIRLIDQEIKIVNDIIETVEGNKEYSKLEVEIINSYRPQIDKVKNPQEGNELQRIINEELKNKVHRKFPKVKESLDKIWNDKSKIELHRIKLPDTPQNITGDQLSGIFEIIEEPKKEDVVQSKSK